MKGSNLNNSRMPEETCLSCRSLPADISPVSSALHWRQIQAGSIDVSSEGAHRPLQGVLGLGVSRANTHTGLCTAPKLIQSGSPNVGSEGACTRSRVVLGLGRAKDTGLCTALNSVQSGTPNVGSEGACTGGQGVLGLGVGRAKDMAKAVVKAHEKARTLGVQCQVYRVGNPKAPK